MVKMRIESSLDKEGLTAADKELKSGFMTIIWLKWNEDLSDPYEALTSLFQGRASDAISTDVLRKLASLAEHIPKTQKEQVIDQLREVWRSKVERPANGDRKKLIACDIKMLVDSLVHEQRRRVMPLPNILPTQPATAIPSTSSARPRFLSIPGNSTPNIQSPSTRPSSVVPSTNTSPPLLNAQGSSMRNIQLPSINEYLTSFRNRGTPTLTPTQAPTRHPSQAPSHQSVQRSGQRFLALPPQFAGTSLQRPAQPPMQRSTSQSSLTDRYTAHDQARLLGEIDSLRQQLDDVKRDRDEILAQRIQIQDALDRFLNRMHPTRDQLEAPEDDDN